MLIYLPVVSDTCHNSRVRNMRLRKRNYLSTSRKSYARQQWLAEYEMVRLARRAFNALEGRKELSDRGLTQGSFLAGLGLLSKGWRAAWGDCDMLKYPVSPDFKMSRVSGKRLPEKQAQ